MKSRIFVSLVFIMAFLMTGCVEKTGYYTKAEDDVISLICDVTWASQKTVNDADETIQGLYTFRRDGTCTQTLIVTDKNGKEQRRVVNMRWAFYDQSSSTIYFGSDHYWDIEELTTKKFAIYDRWGEYGDCLLYTSPSPRD